MAGLIVLLFALGVLALWLARRRQAAAGLPPGRVVYVDTKTLARPSEPLYDPISDLTGRPDYLVEREGTLVPVEVKSGRTPHRPHESHVFQLVAYCLLVEAVYGQRPAYGILKYPAKSFAVDYDLKLEDELREIMLDMRRQRGELPERTHAAAARCRACGYREDCDQRLS